MPTHDPEFLQTVLQSLGEGLIVYDRDLRYRFWSPFMEDLTGLSAAQVLGQPSGEIFPHLREQGVDRFLAQALQGEVAHAPDIRYHVPATGRSGSVRMVYRPHRNQAGHIVGVIAVVHDITRRKLAEERLDRYRLFADTMSDILLFIRQRDGQILDANRAAETAYGYSREDLLARTVYDLRVPDARAVVREQMAIASAQGLRFEALHQRRDGTRFPVEVSSHGTHIQDEPVVLSIVRDITERRRAEEDRHRLARFPEQNPHPVLQVAADGTLLYANPASARWLEVWGSRVGTRLSSTAIAVLDPLLHAATSAEVEVTVEGVTYALLGVPFPQAGYTNLYGRDITERKRAEEALAEHRALLAAVIEEAPDPMVALDREGRYILANSAARRHFDQDPVGKPISEVIATLGTLYDAAGRVIPDTARPPARALRGETVLHEYQRLVRPDGRVSEHLVSATPIHHVRGHPLGTVVLIRDVTAERAAEAQLRATLAEKETALADKLTLLREVHHRTKNNLQMLVDLLYLKAEAVTDPAGKALLEDASARIFAFARLHDQLHLSLHRGAVDIAGYVRAIVGGFQQGYGHIALALTLGSEPLHLDMDRTIHVGLILNELLTNAIKHAFPPGAAAQIQIVLKAADEQVALTVADNGGGLPPGFQFEQVTSVGLRLVHILAQRLKATVTTENQHGACFTIRFPLQADLPVDPL